MLAVPFFRLAMFSCGLISLAEREQPVVIKATAKLYSRSDYDLESYFPDRQLPEGSHTIKVIVDPGNRVGETNDANNEKTAVC